VENLKIHTIMYDSRLMANEILAQKAPANIVANTHSMPEFELNGFSFSLQQAKSKWGQHRFGDAHANRLRRLTPVCYVFIRQLGQKVGEVVHKRNPWLMFSFPQEQSRYSDAVPDKDQIWFELHHSRPKGAYRIPLLSAPLRKKLKGRWNARMPIRIERQPPENRVASLRFHSIDIGAR
jgi:hypothetical protein